MSNQTVIVGYDRLHNPRLNKGSAFTPACGARRRLILLT